MESKKEFFDELENGGNIAAVILKPLPGNMFRCTVQPGNPVSPMLEFSASAQEISDLKNSFPDIPFLEINELIGSKRIVHLKAAFYPKKTSYKVVPYDQNGNGYGEFTFTDEEFEDLKKNLRGRVNIEVHIMDFVTKRDEDKKLYKGKRLHKFVLAGHRDAMKELGFSSDFIERFHQYLKDFVLKIDDADVPENFNRDYLVQAIREGLSAAINYLMKMR